MKFGFSKNDNVGNFSKNAINNLNSSSNFSRGVGFFFLSKARSLLNDGKRIPICSYGIV